MDDHIPPVLDERMETLNGTGKPFSVSIGPDTFDTRSVPINGDCWRAEDAISVRHPALPSEPEQ